ncbi:MAG: UDP-N-acetylmuramoyl-L-alanine--D-glutamate ligase [Gammaproteobacteria bacterium]
MKKDLHYCVLGLGITGISCLDFLIKKKIKRITAIDLKNNSELLQLTYKYPQVNFILGSVEIPSDAELLILSPGIDPSLPNIQQAIQRGAKLTNDINIFLEQIKILKQTKQISIAAITGTNGKTTVVNVLAKMAQLYGIKYALCGNVGEPVLNHLSDDIQLYILELSSFQLELIENLSCKQIFDAACILNVTPDHLDRYIDFTAYCVAKLNIYHQAKHIVYYREDHNTNPNIISKDLTHIKISSFGKSATHHEQHFGIDPENKWLTEGQQKLLLISELSLYGEHNILNSLACLAIGKILRFPTNTMITVLKNFSGLEHRCQTIGTFTGISWINDSKGTNIGATIAAITSTIKYCNTKLIIILGGINKNADLSMLQPYMANNCKAAILIGSCKEQLFEMFNKILDCYIAIDLKMAVFLAKKIATTGDTVLLSPACASFDMFENYKHRGEVFKQYVLELNNANTTST